MRLTTKNEQVFTLASTDGGDQEYRLGPKPTEIPDEAAKRLMALHKIEECDR